MIGDKLIVTLVVVDTGKEWSATGRIDVDTPTKTIESDAYICAGWWCIEVLGSAATGGDPFSEQSRCTTEPKTSKKSRVYP